MDVDLQSLISIYNDKIDFKTYYELMFPKEKYLHQKTKCKLHNEVNGESFSYSPILKIWTCFGQCKMSGKTVEYHKKYTGKPITVVLNELSEMFPYLDLPKIEYKNYFNNSGGEKTIQMLEDLSKPNNKKLDISNDIDDLIEKMFYINYKKED